MKKLSRLLRSAVTSAAVEVTLLCKIKDNSFSKMSAIPEKFHDTQFTSERQVFYILLIIVSGLLIFYNRQKKSKLVRLGDKMPGPKALPIFGNALMVLGKSPSDIVKDSLEYAEKYGNVVRGWLGPKLIVFLNDPADAVPILNSHVHIDKSTEYDFFKPWLGEGLLISTGKKWQSHRKIIAPTFHINILKSFIGVFNQNSQNVVEKMRHEIGKTFDVHDYMSGVTVDILLETVMGITRQKQDESGFDYAMAVMKLVFHINFGF
ncbi:hypothetical protein evm_014512 [Chilo suppressalis]|nr:hypothetical protein evm_014512 [Chilo suppressalis]